MTDSWEIPPIVDTFGARQIVVVTLAEQDTAFERVGPATKPSARCQRT
ncbi:MAG: hypothetical protein H6513_19290 [Acidimicrobiaceae bacterium]|nr:hypothetical protein [Acidimicrobiaceae bacterium]